MGRRGVKTRCVVTSAIFQLNMPCCVVPTCKNASGSTMKQEGITFHVFPGDEKRKSVWTNIIRRARLDELWKPSKRSVVCSIHFDKKYFYNTKAGLRRLNQEAFPNKHLALALEKESCGSGASTPKYVTTLPRSTSPSSSMIGDANISDLEIVFDSPQNIKLKSQLRRKQMFCDRYVRRIKTLQQKYKRLARRNESLKAKGQRESEDESNVSDQLIEHHEIEEDGLQDITEIKLEPPDELDLVDVKTEPEPHTILGSDGGASEGFSRFVRATTTNLPTINMFAVMEFITQNNYYNTLDYQKLKGYISPSNTRLLTGLRVQNCEFIHRMRCTVHLDTSSQCGIEYDTNTSTVRRSECMCSHATCEHVAALLMWLHSVSNQKQYNPRMVPDDVPNLPAPAHIPRVARQLTVSDHGEVILSEPNDPLNVPDAPESMPGPSTAKRKKISPSTPGTKQVTKTKAKPKDTDTKTDESIIKCSFTRKCFFNVWRSTKGNLNEKVRHTRSIMTKAFHDSNYVIDFLPLEKRLEELCMEIEGYWNVDSNREDFETKFAEWFAAVENIDMKKTRRAVVPGSSTSFGD